MRVSNFQTNPYIHTYPYPPTYLPTYRERERQREADRERQTERERETERDRQRETDRDTDRQGRQDRQDRKDRQDRQTARQTASHPSRQTERHTYFCIEIHIQIDRTDEQYIIFQDTPDDICQALKLSSYLLPLE